HHWPVSTRRPSRPDRSADVVARPAATARTPSASGRANHFAGKISPAWFDSMPRLDRLARKLWFLTSTLYAHPLAPADCPAEVPAPCSRHAESAAHSRQAPG